MLIKEKRKIIQKLLIAVVLLAILIPQQQAKAVDWIPTPENLINGFLNWANTAVLEATGKIIMWAARGLEAFVNPQTQGVIVSTFVVNESWRIVRDFVNMFFILILIVMAFGTIFDIQKFHWRSVLVPLLIAALMINFSLTIGEYVIKISNDLASVVLRQISGFSGDMAQGLSIQKSIPGDRFAAAALASIANNSTGLLVSLIFSLVFLVTSLLALLSAFIFALVRIPVLWFLLIVSPIAWIGYSLPSLRGQTWSAWWKHFFCWCFFLPYYLFFLMFAVMFIRRKNDLAASLPSPDSFMATFTGPGGSFTDMLFYVLTMIFMIGGLVAAKKLACASGSGIKTVFGKIEGGVQRYVPGAAYVRGAWGGLKERGEEIKERGVLGIGGAQRTRETEAKARGLIAGIPGLGRAPGAREAIERTELVEIEKEAKRVREQLLRLPADQQKTFLETEKSKRGIAGQAAVLEFAKQGYSTLDDYKEATGKYGGENSVFMRQYLENVKQAKLSDLFKSPDEELRIARGEVEGTRDQVGLRRELYKDLAKRNQISDVAAYKEAKQLLSSIPAELKSFLDSIKPEYVVGTREARQDAIRNRTLGDPDLERKLVEFMKDKKEINDVQLRQEALAIVGGKNTIEGRNVINEINKFNPVINIEADLREERGIPVDRPLSAEDNNTIVGEIAKKIAEKEFADLRKMSGKFWEDTKTQQAVRQTFDGDDIAQLLENAPKEMKRALKNVSRRGPVAGGGDAKRPAGFVPPGSMVTPEGKVVPPEEK